MNIENIHARRNSFEDTPYAVKKAKTEKEMTSLFYAVFDNSLLLSEIASHLEINSLLKVQRCNHFFQTTIDRYWHQKSKLLLSYNLEDVISHPYEEDKGLLKKMSQEKYSFFLFKKIDCLLQRLQIFYTMMEQSSNGESIEDQACGFWMETFSQYCDLDQIQEGKEKIHQLLFPFTKNELHFPSLFSSLTFLLKSIFYFRNSESLDSNQIKYIITNSIEKYQKFLIKNKDSSVEYFLYFFISFLINQQYIHNVTENKSFDLFLEELLELNQYLEKSHHPFFDSLLKKICQFHLLCYFPFSPEQYEKIQVEVLKTLNFITFYPENYTDTIHIRQDDHFSIYSNYDSVLYMYKLFQGKEFILDRSNYLSIPDLELDWRENRFFTFYQNMVEAGCKHFFSKQALKDCHDFYVEEADLEKANAFL